METEESLNKNEGGQEDYLPLEYRNPFQIEVFKRLILIGKLTREDVLDTERFGKIISDFIDNPQNTKIRELILQRQFKEAAELMVTEIGKEENYLEAA